MTTGRPGRRETPLGIYEFRHLNPALFFGYRLTDLGGGQAAFLATPEKALLDLVYLQPGGDRSAWLEELRLQNLMQLDLDALRRMAGRFGRPKMARAAERIIALARSDSWKGTKRARPTPSKRRNWPTCSSPTKSPSSSSTPASRASRRRRRQTTSRSKGAKPAWAVA